MVQLIPLNYDELFSVEIACDVGYFTLTKLLLALISLGVH